MYRFGISVVVEKKAFMLHYTKGIFSFEPYSKDSISLSRHLSMEINNYIFNSDLFDILGFKFSLSTSYNFINLASHLDSQYIKSQSVSKKNGVVYLVSDGCFTKIGGTSYNVPKRLLELQTGNAKKLSIIGSYPTSYLLQSERLVQNKYKDDNIRNEWFKLDSKQISNILHKKEVFKNTIIPRHISRQSRIDILFAQHSLIKDVRDYEVKVLRRLSNKLPYSYSGLLRKIVENDFKSDAVASYSAKKINFQKYQSDLNNLIKKMDHAKKLSEYIDFINIEKIKCMEEYNFYYSDEEGIFRDSITNENITDDVPSFADVV